MEQDRELKRLEKFVENLLTRFTELRTEKAVLLQEIRDRDEIIEELRESVSSKDSERSEVSLRVEKIVGQIEEWEQSLNDDEFDEIPPVDEESDVETAAEEETASAEETDSDESTDAEDAKEEEGKGQQNLFSIETS
jgi:hypothetical protein